MTAASQRPADHHQARCRIQYAIGIATDVTSAASVEQGRQILDAVNPIVNELLAEIGEQRGLLTRAGEALRKLALATIVVKPTLDRPYPDRPDATPWTLWVHRPARIAYDVGTAIRRREREGGGT